MAYNNADHEFYVDLLYKRLKPKFEYMEKHVGYERGEIDILARQNGCLFDFEVKCSERHRKTAIEQLYRWKRHFKEGSRKKHGFVYIGNEDLLDAVF